MRATGKRGSSDVVNANGKQAANHYAQKCTPDKIATHEIDINFFLIVEPNEAVEFIPLLLPDPSGGPFLRHRPWSGPVPLRFSDQFTSSVSRYRIEVNSGA